MDQTGLVKRFEQKPRLFSFILLLIVGLLAYGIMLPLVGFYGDDWSYIWLLYKGGGIDVFLWNNRGLLIPLFKFLGQILGSHPLPWQIYNFCLHLLTAFSFWLVLDQLWPALRKYTRLAAVLFLIYPGYKLSYVSVNMSIFFIVLPCLLFSFYLSLRVERTPAKKWLFLAGSLLLEIINLTLTEYFFFMELIRPVLLYLQFRRMGQPVRQSIKKSFTAWLPFLGIFVIAVIWRKFNQTNINGYYTLTLLENLKANPLAATFQWIKQMAGDMFKTNILAWAVAVYPKAILRGQHLPYYYYLGAILLVGALLAFFIYRRSSKSVETGPVSTGLLWIGLGVLWSLFSGWPIWLAQLKIGTDFVTSRFFLPFIIGSVLVAAGLVMLLARQRIAQAALTALLIISSIGFQNLLGNNYRMDWQSQKAFFTQLYWRFGQIKPGTLFIFSESPTSEGEENSFSAEMNWIFSPTKADKNLDYYGYFIEEKFDQDNPGMLDGQPVLKGHHIGDFTASAEQIVTVYIDKRNCIRVLYPRYDTLRGQYNSFTRQMAAFSNPSAAEDKSEIMDDAITPREMLSSTFGAPAQPDWCQFYQQADMLRQKNDWSGIAEISDQINPLDFLQDWQKLTLFVEANARAGRSDRAAELLHEIDSQTPTDKTMYCAITSDWIDTLSPSGKFLEEITRGRRRFKCASQ